jgi:hypothetical protein
MGFLPSGYRRLSIQSKSSAIKAYSANIIMSDLEKKAREFIDKVQGKMEAFTDGRKETFSNNLSEQIRTLSAKLDSRQQQQLQGLSIPQIVDDVSQAVVNNVVGYLKAWVDLAKVC